ncbi:MAG: hypothetical protein NWF04_01480 [Candidatus Bathyarchaeota archaeon]|nr:hypothetical protein [Candidatus Bathyarchaeota archaeon]
MHDYAIDSNERFKVALCLAIASILLMTAVQGALDHFNLQVPWWIDGISVFGLYGLFLYFFDTYIWKWRFTKIVGLVKGPNIAGVYEGTLASSYDNFKNPIPISVEVFQTWTKISINWRTATSSSRSLVASIITNSEPNILTYQYLNEPKTSAPSTMHMHRGTAIADITGGTLNGGCYSNRDRQTTGQFELKKIIPSKKSA